MISLKNLVLQTYPEALASFLGPDTEVLGVESDSRKVQRGFVFIAVRGSRSDGNAYIAEALKRGALAVVGDRAPSGMGTVPFILVPDARLAVARLAGEFYSHPSKQMKLAGITGTNGKTTSSFLIEHMLRGEGKNTGVIGTVNYRFGGKEIPADETTPGPLRLQKLLVEMRQAKCEYAVMEVSAHAIDQSRVEGLDFQTALFTNLTQDHLDYFKSMEAYFECKAKFFTALSPDQWAILNQDDERVRSLKGKLRAKTLTFGIHNGADLKAEAIESDLAATRFHLAYKGRSIPVEIPLTGLHNVYNVLGSLAVMVSFGFDPASAAAHLRGFRGVPGRLERVDRGQGFYVFVDYAHTPDGLENVLKNLQAYKKRKLITLFGCGGDRDKGKRPQMGKVASEYSDTVVVTSDNPRSEDPKEIASQIVGGFPAGFQNYTVNLDRKKAIRLALLSAREGDIVLLAGKGHETTQVIGTESLPFSDREEAERVLDGR